MFRLVLKKLAEFQAVSFGLIAKVGGKEKFLETYPFMAEVFDMSKPETSGMMDQMFDSNISLLCGILEVNPNAQLFSFQDICKRYKNLEFWFLYV